MRILPRHLVLPLLALAFADPRTMHAQEARGILFTVVRAEDGEGVLEPVALLLPEGFTEPMREHTDSALQAFNARWLNPGRAYEVLSRGERVGGIAVRTADEPACYGMNARGRLDVRPIPDDGWQALAGEGLPEQPGAPWLRAPTAVERREMDRMAAALFDAHGIDVAGRTRGDTARTTLVVHRNARPLLIASYSLAAEESVLRQAAVLVVAEDGQDGYRPALAWFYEGVEAGVEARELVDAADLDGDGMPELVVRGMYYEHWDFIILRRTEHGWMEIYRGGGGGC